MQIKKIYQISLVLLLAITLTACTGSKKKKTPGDSDGGIDNGGEEIENTICEKYPNSDICKIILDMTEIKIEDAKPSQKHFDDQNIISWSDPVKYSKGFQYKGSKPHVTVNFAVDTGSILNVGDKYDWYFFSPEQGKILDKWLDISITQTPNTSAKDVFGNIGEKYIAIAVLKNKTYLILPPIELV